MCPTEHPSSQDGFEFGASWTRPWRCKPSGTGAPDRCTRAPRTNGDPGSDTWPWRNYLWWPSCKSGRSGLRQESAWHFQPWWPPGLEEYEGRHSNTTWCRRLDETDHTLCKVFIIPVVNVLIKPLQNLQQLSNIPSFRATAIYIYG